MHWLRIHQGGARDIDGGEGYYIRGVRSDGHVFMARSLTPDDLRIKLDMALTLPPLPESNADRDAYKGVEGWIELVSLEQGDEPDNNTDHDREN